MKTVSRGPAFAGLVRAYCYATDALTPWVVPTS
jgi:hypothetical protein